MHWKYAKKLVESSRALRAWAVPRVQLSAVDKSCPHAFSHIMGVDYYKVLDVPKGADEDTIKKGACRAWCGGD